MSVRATSRAWESKARGNELLVLLALADHAGGEDDPYDFAYPSVARVAEMTRLSRRTVQRCLRALEDSGLIAQTGTHQWGGGKATTQYRVEGGRQIDAPRQIDAGVSGDQGGASPVTPNPSKEPSSSSGERARARDDQPQEDFPEPLLPHLREVYRVLRDLAVRHQAKRVSVLSLSSVVMARQFKPLVRAAYDYTAWADGKAQRRRDVVAGYRNWLDRCDDLAGHEPPPGDGPARSSGSSGKRPAQDVTFGLRDRSHWRIGRKG